MDKNKSKFNWEEGDVKFQLPQCSDCERNTGPYTCEIYGDKPIQFTRNEEVCVYKVLETN